MLDLLSITIKSIFNVIPGAVSDGIAWGILAIGVYLTFRVLDFADMSVEGTIALGGCTTAILVCSGANIYLAMLVSLVAGALAGALTGVLYTKLKIPAILSGILVMFALYSINVHILGGKTSLALLGTNTIFNLLLNGGCSVSVASLIITVSASVVVVGVIYWFFGTKLGSAVRATGCNAVMSRAQGINTDFTTILGLAIANSLSALAGSILVQTDCNATVNMGSGAIVIGLAGVVLGEVFIKEKWSFWIKLMFVIIGSVVYRIIIAIAIKVVTFLTMDDLKLISAVIIATVLATKHFSSKKIKTKETAKAKEGK